MGRRLPIVAGFRRCHNGDVAEPRSRPVSGERPVMLSRILAVAAVLLALVVVSLPAPAADRPKEQLVDQVKASIDRGIRFLKQQEAGRGHWEVNTLAAFASGGWSAMAVLALLNAGVKPDDPTVARGLEWLRQLKPGGTYVRGLQTMVFAEAGLERDRALIQENVNWLLQARVYRGGKFAGWGYSLGVGNADNSN